MIKKQNVPLLDLKAQFSRIENEVREAIDGVLKSQMFIMGPEVTAFEQEIADFCGATNGIGVSSGTDALLVSLMALGIGPGDEVITSPYTFFATAGAIARLGAKPVFVDIDHDTYNIDPGLIEAVITTKTRAILPVHLFGQCAEMDSVLDLARHYEFPVIEDAAQAIGATDKGRHAGSMGTAGCFSFFPSKNLGGYGDGGMVLTSDGELAEKIKVLRVHGSKPKYFHEVIGGNFRLDALQAAVLRVKLRYLAQWSGERAQNAEMYNRKIAACGISQGRLSMPVIRQESHIYHQYVIRTPERDGLEAYLREYGIGCQIYFPLSLHGQECFKNLGYKPGSLPQSEKAAEETLAIPVYPEMTEEQIDYVVSVIAEYFA